MEQGSKSWLEWRNAGIGASDTPIILGLSPYKTCFQLWQEKTGLVKPSDITLYAKAKGGEVEAQLRARYSLDSAKNFEPVLAEMDDNKFIKASLDGYADGEAIEIKFVGKEKYESDTIPETHYWQMQHQMLVLDLTAISYLKSIDGVEYKKQQCLRNEADCQRVLMSCIVFQGKVLTKTPPPKTEQDTLEAEGVFLAMLELYKAGKIDKKEIKANMPHQRMTGAGLKLTLSSNGALRVI